jgi:hypothetical protein
VRFNDRRRQVFVEREDQIQPENIRQISKDLLDGEFNSIFGAPAFVKFVNRIPHDRRDPVEEFPSRAISVQDVTTLPGIIFAPKVIHYS